MRYNVTYRNKEGLQETIQIESENRTSLFDALGKRGINAIRIEEAIGKPKKTKPSPAIPSARKHSPFRGILAGLLVIAIGVAAWFYLLPTLEQVKARMDKKPSLIAEVAPEIAEPAVEEEIPEEASQPAPKPDPRYFVPEGSYRGANGRLYTPSGRRILEKPPARVISTRDENDKRIFNSMAENEIMKLITVQPGQFFVPAIYGPSFLHSFEESLKRPIEILPDDTDEVKAIKQAVIEVKEELAERYAAHEDISQIMKDTQNEFLQLSLYKRELENTIINLIKEGGSSEEDVEAYTEAANKLLEERGVPPITSARMHSVRWRTLERQHQNGE